MKTSRSIAVFLSIICMVFTITVNIASCAAAPSQEKESYRMMVGDFEVIVLSDGINQRTVEQQLQLLYGNQADMKDALSRAYPDGQIESTVNAFLINTGYKLVLVDAGNGKMGSPTMGEIIHHLNAAGFQPEKIDEIYLTHMHGDHIGGLVSGEEIIFPNATVYAHRLEAEYWLSDVNLDNAPDSAKRGFQTAKAALTPYVYTGRFKTFEGNIDLAPGIRAEALFGHTPGHTAYFVESKGKTVVLWGDIVHVAAVQFNDPSVTIAYDSNRDEAARTRQRILNEAAKNGWLIGGAHLAYPGLGHVKKNDAGGCVFVPVNSPVSE